MTSVGWKAFAVGRCIMLMGAIMVSGSQLDERSKIVDFQHDDELALDARNGREKIKWKDCVEKSVVANGVLFHGTKGVSRLILDNTSVFLAGEKNISGELKGHLVRVKGKFTRRRFGGDNMTTQTEPPRTGYFIDVESVEMIEQIETFPIILQ